MNRSTRCLVMIVALVVAAGCTSYRKHVPPQKLSLGVMEDFDVLTRDGTIYHFIHARVTLLEIEGRGDVFAPPAERSTLAGSLVDDPDDRGEPFVGAVPMSEVVLAQTHHLNGLHVLLTMAASAVLVSAATSDDGEAGGGASIGIPGSGGGSCPYVYSFDGDRYRLDAEPFVGSIARELEQTSWNVLPHLATLDGRATVALCNQAPESQYLNSARLLAFDHPAGSRLVLDTDGKALAVGREWPPAEARDLAGDDVLSLVSENDGRDWRTDPPQIDPDRPATLQDGIVCRFPIPESAATATIVLDLGNSNLGEFVTHKLLGEGGSTRLAWYRDLAADPRRPAMVAAALLRLGGLTVEAWDGGRWRQLDIIPVVGGVVRVERAVAAEITGGMDGELRVRLRGAAGLWSLDAVKVDFAATAPAPPVPLDVADFRSTRHGATPNLLEESDQGYLSLFPGDWAVLQYAAPTSPPTGARTFVFEARGHYYPWAGATWSDGPPSSRRALPDGGEVYREWLDMKHDFTPPGAPPELPRPVAAAS